MSDTSKGILIALLVITGVVIIINWKNVMAFLGISKGKPQEGDKCIYQEYPVTRGGIIKDGICVEEENKKDCKQEYFEAQTEWEKSGQACVMTIVELVCPTNKDFKVSVNPCVGKILESKGWKTPPVDEVPVTIQPTPSNEAEVINPAGAIMYYQSSLASGGLLYSASNINIPKGSKMNVIKIWQTSPNNLPFTGYLETEYKQYGPNSGFFDAKDLKKS